MDFKSVFSHVGTILEILGILALIPIFVSWLFGENIYTPFFITAVLAFGIGSIMDKKFKKTELVKDGRQKAAWMARQHHDYQREGSTTGYYSPGMDPRTDGGNTLILAHRNLKKPEISEHELLDDVIIEVNWEGKKVWEWVCSDHFEEMGFNEEARNILARNPSLVVNGGDGFET